MNRVITLVAPPVFAVLFGIAWVGLSPAFWYRVETTYTPPPDFTPQKGAPVFAKGGLIRLGIIVAVFAIIVMVAEYLR